MCHRTRVRPKQNLLWRAVHPGDGPCADRGSAAQPGAGQAAASWRRHQQFRQPQGLPQPAYLTLQRALEGCQVPHCCPSLHVQMRGRCFMYH